MGGASTGWRPWQPTGGPVRGLGGAKWAARRGCARLPSAALGGSGPVEERPKRGQGEESGKRFGGKGVTITRARE